MKNLLTAETLAPDFNAIQKSAKAIVDKSRSVNRALAKGKIRHAFRAHFVCADQRICGISELIEQILRDAGAVFPDGAETTALRNVVVSTALTVDQIHAETVKRFGPERYPKATLYVYLSPAGSKQNKGTQFRAVSRTKAESGSRFKPKSVYYVAE